MPVLSILQFDNQSAYFTEKKNYHYTLCVTQRSHPKKSLSTHELCFNMEMQNVHSILYRKENFRKKIPVTPSILKISSKSELSYI